MSKQQQTAAFAAAMQHDFSMILVDHRSPTGVMPYQLDWKGKFKFAWRIGYPADILGGDIVQRVGGVLFFADAIPLGSWSLSNLAVQWGPITDATHGMSGGAWVTNLNGTEGDGKNVLVAVTSGSPPGPQRLGNTQQYPRWDVCRLPDSGRIQSAAQPRVGRLQGLRHAVRNCAWAGDFAADPARRWADRPKRAIAELQRASGGEFVPGCECYNRDHLVSCFQISFNGPGPPAGVALATIISSPCNCTSRLNVRPLASPVPPLLPSMRTLTDLSASSTV